MLLKSTFLLNEENHSVVDKIEIKPLMEVEMCVLGQLSVNMHMRVCMCVHAFERDWEKE